MTDMRKLLNIVTESAGDSRLPLDKLAEKYLGAGSKWDDTHYKNILYQVRPLSEMFMLAARLGEDIVEELGYDLDEIATPFTGQMAELIATDEESDDQAEYYFSDAYMIPKIKKVVDADSSPDGNGYWVYTGNDFEIVCHPGDMGTCECWYIGNPQSVLTFLSQWRTKFNNQKQKK
jgi:hypothetical protein